MQNGYCVLFVEVKPVILVNYPLYCPKCKHECLIKAEHLHITVIKEPAAKTQSR